ncbi:MAG TPA: DNA-directed RNA polymerase subunit K [Thermoplasmata archaeon]|nr:DNA-directed RNA polymerase subunit K [Thermoplasmata archaeon]
MIYTRFERARIIGARALQISMGAPILLDGIQSVVDPMEISMREFEAGVVPITVKRLLDAVH